MPGGRGGVHRPGVRLYLLWLGVLRQLRADSSHDGGQGHQGCEGSVEGDVPKGQSLPGKYIERDSKRGSNANYYIYTCLVSDRVAYTGADLM